MKVSKGRLASVSLNMLALGTPILSFAQELGDPQGSGVVISAMQWLQNTLLGTVATIAAVIAVAVVGFMMLTGRINWRHGATVILGCFILFGAASIVGGIRTAATAGY
ncbi:MAG TPA: TrbC/VirB2 family protein [Sphingobium sp.]